MVVTAHLFPELDAKLLELFESLTPDEWRLPTIVPRWTVHDVAAHLLDTALRRLAICRDGWSASGAAAPQSDRELADLINRLNAQGVATFSQCSPALITDLTKLVTPQLATYFASLDPAGPALFAVSWAGERSSANWFDVARDLTERWHHQQQIRLATGRPGIMTPRLYGRVLETFMRVLPHAYRDVSAPEGTACDVVVPGACGGHWRVRRVSEQWALMPPDSNAPASIATVPDDLAWRLFTKGVSRAEARARVSIHGDERLGSVVLSALAIVS